MPDCELLSCDLILSGFPSLPGALTLPPASSPPFHFLPSSALKPFFLLSLHILSEGSHPLRGLQTLNNTNVNSSTAAHLLSTHSVPGSPLLASRR